MKIYLDNSATTRVSQGVIEAMKPYFFDCFGNPSSIHSFGQAAKIAVDIARKTIADFLKCDPIEIIFTSGGTESDNLAIRGVVEAHYKDIISAEARIQDPRVKPEDDNRVMPHVITTAFEHHAVLNTVKDLEKQGKIEATYIEPDHEGLINPLDIERAIRKNTVLVSVMYVNNETGVTQPIGKIGEIIRHQTSDIRRIYFHTDAVQATEFCPMDVQELGVDLLTLTAHKIHGPKGIGLLYVKRGVPIKSQIIGGDQEFRLRAGTENVPAIAGLSAALAEVESQKSEVKNVESLRDRLELELTKIIPNSIINGKNADRAPHISNISFLNAEGESIILNLDMEGIAVSSGSACTSESLEPSHVLTSMGVSPEQAHGSIRFSLSRETTTDEIDHVIEILPPIIKKLRDMSPLRN